MNIAILGGTSQIARDLTVRLVRAGGLYVDLFGRRPEHISRWIQANGLEDGAAGDAFSAFTTAVEYDAVLNFVGVGNPGQAASMGTSILDVTLEYDTLALEYIKKHRNCRYFFLSSGAVYGGGFAEPASLSTPAVVPINHLAQQDWYGIAKLTAECRHRALSDLPIVDLRVFSYFSSTQDLEARFLISDLLRAVRDGTLLFTSPDQIFRDFLHPDDFARLIENLLAAPAMNCPMDCYSKAPIDKLTLLDEMQKIFGLRYQISDEHNSVNATGLKSHYYSVNRHAQALGYSPEWTSLECIISEGRKALEQHARFQG